MKLILQRVGFLILCSFLFMACENEPLSEDINIENPTNPEPEPGEVITDEIIGDWLISDYTITTTNTVDFEGVEIVSVAETVFASGDQILTFTEDNQFSAAGEITINVSTYVDGVFAGQTTESVDNFSSGTWSIDGNQLVMNDNVTGEFSSLILTLNAQTLELYIEVDNESLGLPDDPLFGVVTGEGTVIYNKVQ